jgi:nucleotide-binding universal stress UspA family protein
MKFDHILFPIDFSESSRLLNEQVEQLAACFGSRITLLHVFEMPALWYGISECSYINLDAFNAIRETTQKLLNDYSIHIPEPRVNRLMLEGNAAGQITAWAKENAVDLIIVATHGYGALEGLLLGSVTAKVLHAATCPVWTDSPVHPRASHSAITKIVCALEVTSEDLPLLQFTKQLAQRVGASVKLVHSVPETESRREEYFDSEFHKDLIASARVGIAALQEKAGTDFPLIISEAGIAKAIADTATGQEADLIVIGRGEAMKTFGRFRTHVHQITRHAPCPVLSYCLQQQALPVPAYHVAQSAKTLLAAVAEPLATSLSKLPFHGKLAKAPASV